MTKEQIFEKLIEKSRYIVKNMKDRTEYIEQCYNGAINNFNDEVGVKRLEDIYGEFGEMLSSYVGIRDSFRELLVDLHNADSEN